MLYSDPLALGHTQDELHLSTGVDIPVDKTSISAEHRPLTTVWDQALSRLRPKVSAQNFDLWFSPISFSLVQQGQIALTAPNRFIKEWFEAHFLQSVLHEMQQLSNTNYDVLWIIDEKASTCVPEEQTKGCLDSLPSLQSPSSLSFDPLPERPELLSRYTFQSFVVGPSNQLAEAASRAVAQNPGGKYNPLFIYGGVGLGKTHLLHAMGHSILEAHPTWKIVYIKTETFMNEYIQAVRNNKIDEFRVKYRKQPHVLLVDDIQYLGGKERTQDEFFHTFNALFEAGHQIVVAADKYPHQIPDLEERIRSRFQWGLIADIQTPELETRMAILAKKAEFEEIELPTDVAYFLASRICSNVRELEGLLIRVAAFASLQQQKISIDFAKESLKHILPNTGTRITIDLIQRKIASHFRMSQEDLTSEKRQQAIAKPRQIAMYLSRKFCKLSYPDIAKHFGKKDHTTVLAACRKIEKSLQEDVSLRQTVLELERQLS